MRHLLYFFEVCVHLIGFGIWLAVETLDAFGWWLLDTIRWCFRKDLKSDRELPNPISDPTSQHVEPLSDGDVVGDTSVSEKISRAFSSYWVACERVERVANECLIVLAEVAGFLAKLVPRPVVRAIVFVSDVVLRFLSRAWYVILVACETLEEITYVLLDAVSEAFGFLVQLIPPQVVDTARWATYIALDIAVLVWCITSYILRIVANRLTPYVTGVAFVGYRICAPLADFIVKWHNSRDYCRLAFSLPAIILSGLLFVPFTLSSLQTKHDKMVHYQLALLKANENNDVVQQTLCLQRLEQLGYHRQELAEFQTAMSIAMEGDYGAAYEKVSKIAPVESPGFRFGHLWIAHALLEEKIDKLSRDEKQRWTLIDKHIQHAISLDSTCERTKRLKVEADIHFGRDAAAVEGMLEIASSYPEMHVALMRLYAREGDTASAKTHAQRVVSNFSDVPKQQSASMYLAEADRILEGGGLQPMGTTKVALAQRSWTSMAMSAIDSALRLASRNRVSQALPSLIPVPERLGRFNVEPADATSGRQYSVAAEKYLRDGDRFYLDEQYGQALEKYKSACKVDQDCAVAWNNIAWILSNIEPLQMEEALDAANRGLRIDDLARIRETRGQILLKLQRWQEAMSDLEKALNGAPRIRQSAHLGLAVAYEKLGDPQTATAHRMAAVPN